MKNWKLSWIIVDIRNFTISMNLSHISPASGTKFIIPWGKDPVYISLAPGRGVVYARSSHKIALLLYVLNLSRFYEFIVDYVFKLFVVSPLISSTDESLDSISKLLDKSKLLHLLFKKYSSERELFC